MDSSAMDGMREALPALTDRLADTRRRIEALLDRDGRELGERVALGGVTGAKLRSDAIVLAGRPSQRMTVKRIEVGEAVALPFATSVGVTECATDAADVRELWDRLLAFELATDGVMHGNPSTVLDVPGASVSVRGTRTLHVDMRAGDAPDEDVIAVPRLTYAMPARKLRNFGHWLLDCLPQVAALVAVAPDAKLLLPRDLRPFHHWSLRKAGVSPSQIVEWDGAPRACARLLAFESDGRAGGGRPLSGVRHLRSRIGPDAEAQDDSRPRRIYVSRRDARAKRQWVRNEHDIEELFRSRGFEIVSMAHCPLDEQVHVFRNARVVAGVSGAGLTGLIFSPPGTKAIVLASDRLIRWYAEQSGARSLWLRGVSDPRHLAALGDSPRFYTHLAAAFDQVCHSFVGPDEMPIDRLSRFLDAALDGADGC